VSKTKKVSKSSAAHRENSARRRGTPMNRDGRRVGGTLIVKGALHQTYDEDKVSGDWVTSTCAGTFASRPSMTWPYLSRVVLIDE